MQDTSTPLPARWTLRRLPLAARLTLAAYLIAVGLGYLTALVNLHFQEARPDEILPSDEDVVSIYSGKSKVSQWERVLVAHPSLPFNGQGSMRAVLTGPKAGGWTGAVKKRLKALKLDPNVPTPMQVKEAEKAVQTDLDGERLSLIAWVKAGAVEKPYEDDAFVRGDNLKGHPVTAKYLDEDESVKIKSIIEDRCASCHSEGKTGSASNYPLNTYEDVTHYTSAEKSTGKSLPKPAGSRGLRRRLGPSRFHRTRDARPHRRAFSFAEPGSRASAA